MEHGIAMDIALCIITAWVIAVASQVARQPLVLEAADLLHVLDAVEKNLLDERRKVQAEQLEERKEVIP